MKTLFIVRHAKSSWDFPQLADHMRPLIKKGIRRTNRIVEYLLEHKIQVDLILSSHAVRAFDTARIIGRSLNLEENKIQISDDIYNGNINTLQNMLFGIDEQVNHLMIVGHNPIFTSFANLFTVDKIEWLPTSGVACIEFETNKWNEIMIAPRHTKFVVTPGILKNNKSK